MLIKYNALFTFMNYIINLTLKKNNSPDIVGQFLAQVDLDKNYSFIGYINEIIENSDKIIASYSKEQKKEITNNISRLLKLIETHPYDSELIVKAIETKDDVRFKDRMTGNRFYSNEAIRPEYFMDKKIDGKTYKEISLEIACSNPML